VVWRVAASLIDAFVLARPPTPDAKTVEPSVAPSMCLWKGPDHAAHPALGLEREVLTRFNRCTPVQLNFAQVPDLGTFTMRQVQPVEPT